MFIITMIIVTMIIIIMIIVIMIIVIMTIAVTDYLHNLPKLHFDYYLIIIV